MSVSVDGGGVTELATTPGGFPYSVAVDETSVYWTDLQANLVMKVALTGGTPTTLAVRGDTSQPAGIAVDDASVYWAEYGAGSVMKLTPK